MRTTRTFATLGVSPFVFGHIAERLRVAGGQDERFLHPEALIQLDGVALEADPNLDYQTAVDDRTISEAIARLETVVAKPLPEIAGRAKEDAAALRTLLDFVYMFRSTGADTTAEAVCAGDRLALSIWPAEVRIPELSESQIAEALRTFGPGGGGQIIPLRPIPPEVLRWAEDLIVQLPETHDGRNSWLLNHGNGPEAVALQDQRASHDPDYAKFLKGLRGTADFGPGYPDHDEKDGFRTPLSALGSRGFEPLAPGLPPLAAGERYIAAIHPRGGIDVLDAHGRTLRTLKPSPGGFEVIPIGREEIATDPRSDSGELPPPALDAGGPWEVLNKAPSTLDLGPGESLFERPGGQLFDHLNAKGETIRQYRPSKEGYGLWEGRNIAAAPADDFVSRAAEVAKSGNRLTPADIDAAIVGEEFFVSGTLTICVLTLRNGFCVTGTSACIDPANFDAALGQDAARAKAKDQVWLVESYLAKDRFSKTLTIKAQPTGLVVGVWLNGTATTVPAGRSTIGALRDALKIDDDDVVLFVQPQGESAILLEGEGVFTPAVGDAFSTVAKIKTKVVPVTFEGEERWIAPGWTTGADLRTILGVPWGHRFCRRPGSDVPVEIVDAGQVNVREGDVYSLIIDDGKVA